MCFNLSPDQYPQTTSTTKNKQTRNQPAYPKPANQPLAHAPLDRLMGCASRCCQKPRSWGMMRSSRAIATALEIRTWTNQSFSLKKKIFGGSGTCLFPQKQGPRDAWEGGCWELLVLSESPVSDPFLLEIKNRPGWTTTVNRL